MASEPPEKVRLLDSDIRTSYNGDVFGQLAPGEADRLIRERVAGMDVLTFNRLVIELEAASRWQEGGIDEIQSARRTRLWAALGVSPDPEGEG